MAADSSTNETDAAAPPGEDKPPALREASGGPPRPPRPAKSLRIPLPSSITPGSKLNGAARAEVAGKVLFPPASSALVSPLAPVTSPAPSSAPLGGTSHAPSSAPAVATTDAPAPPVAEDLGSGIPTPVPAARSSQRPPAAIVTPAVPNDPSTNLEFALTRRSSAAPPLSFDSAEVDPSDRAPAAPVTPWRDVPPLNAEVESLAPATAVEDHDHEDTIVGQVPKDLLDLASEDEDESENTRAYQAPQELIDLARRQREERRQARAGAAHERSPKAAFHDSQPPTARKDVEQDQSEIHTATVPAAAVAAAEAVLMKERTRPAPGPVAAPRAPRAKQPSLTDLAREVSERRLPGSLPAPAFNRDVAPDSAVSVSGYDTPWLTRGRVWALSIGAFIVVGYALARWRGLDLP